MQFTDRIRTEKCLNNLYKPYGSSNRVSPLSDKTGKYSKCPKCDALYGPYTDRKVSLRSVQTVRIVKLYKPLSQIRRENILSVLNEMQFTDRIRTEKCLYDPVQTVRIVKLYKPLSEIRQGNILSVLNKMQFTDRIPTVECLHDLYKPYGSSNHTRPSLR